MALAPARLDAALRHLRRADPVLKELMTRVGPCQLRVDTRGSAYAALVEAIQYQQITGKAAAAIYRRLTLLLGRSYPRPEDVAAVTDVQLRGAGLSRQKIAYMRDLTRRAQDGLPLGRLGRLPDEEVIEALTQVKGIGRWTAEMLLIFRLGRLDVMPVHDYGIRKAMQRAYRMRGLPRPDRMRRLSESWRPYRTIACWYLWRSIGGAAGKP